MGEKVTEEDLTQWLGGEDSPFGWKSSFCCVPNVSHGFLAWEADFIQLTKSRYLVEVEVKISAADWRHDQKKKKFIYRDDQKLQWTAQAKEWGRIREFWYAAPMALAERWQEMGIPDWAGVMGIDLAAEKPWNVYKNFRSATVNRKAEKLEPLAMAHLARLGTIRLWTRKPQDPKGGKP